MSPCPGVQAGERGEGGGGKAGCAASCIPRGKEWGEEPLLLAVAVRAALPHVTATGSPEAMLHVGATTALKGGHRESHTPPT